MKTIEQIERQREMCQAILANALNGQHKEIMWEYLRGVLEIPDTCASDNPHITYYNLGLLGALGKLTQEAQNYERRTSR